MLLERSPPGMGVHLEMSSIDQRAIDAFIDEHV